MITTEPFTTRTELMPQPAAPRLFTQPKKIAPAVPKYSGHFLSIIAFDGNVTLETLNSVMGVQARAKTWRGWKFFAGSGQGRSRNECAHYFMYHTDCAFHFLSDADLLFNEAHVLSLRKHPEAADAIICGAYPKKQEKIEFCLNSLPDGPEQPNARNLIEVAKGGTGFMQIPRSAYEKIQAKFPELVYECDYEKNPDGSCIKKMEFFLEAVKFDPFAKKVRHLTEDWMFCDMARAAGVKIYVDLSTTVNPWMMHRGPILYPLPVEIERERVQAELDEAKLEIKRLKDKNAELCNQVPA